MMMTTAEAAMGALGAAAGAGLVAGGFAYASLWPASRLFGTALIAPARAGEIALTFDDGPNGKWTPKLLDTLAGYGLRANFFLLGRAAVAESSIVRRMAAEGHLIGNHSWSHPRMSTSSSKLIREELHRTQETLQQITGKPAVFFRPPYGARRPAVFRIAREMGLRTVLWNAMTADWSERSDEKIAAALMGTVDRANASGSAANIVLHDGGHNDLNADREPSVMAAGKLAAHYAATHRFVTLDAWV